MKKAIAALLSIFLIFSLVGCASPQETQDTLDAPSTADGVKDAADEKSYVSVPDTNVPEFPNSQLIYTGENSMIYETSDSGDTVYDFYNNHPNLKSGREIREGYYYITTPLNDIIMDMNPEGKQDRINEYINEFGGLTALTISDANLDEQFKMETTGAYYSEIPLDKTLIVYVIY